MNTDFHALVLARLDTAQKWTKKFHDEIKESLEDYKAETPKISSLDELLDDDKARYNYTSKLIFNTVETYRSALFEKIPDVMYSRKGAQDEEKELIIKASWEYLKDAVNFERFQKSSSFWFFLIGFASAHMYHEQEIESIEVDQTAEGEPVELPYAEKDDPCLEAGNPLKEWFYPDSQFSEDGKDICFFRKKTMTVSEVKKRYGVAAEADEEIEESDEKQPDSVKNDRKRVGVYYGYGYFPSKYMVEEAQEGELDDEEQAYVVFTKKTILATSESPIEEIPSSFGRWYAPENEFFGFGLGKILRENQKQESIRMGQRIRYADLFAYPKLAMSGKDKLIDEKAVLSRNYRTLLYTEAKPEWIMPPASNGVVESMMQANTEASQSNSGMIDFSKQQTSKVLQTATGQTQVNESNERRVKIARQQYAEFLKQTVIKLFKFCQRYWTTEKIMKITDDDGREHEIVLTKEVLQDINFDTDIAIDIETSTVNKDVVRQQSIALYDKVKDDPLVERGQLLKDMVFRDGFDFKNADKYIKPSGLQPGLQLMSPDGQAFVVDESGQVVPQQDMNETAPDSGESSLEPASDQSAVQSSPYQV